MKTDILRGFYGQTGTTMSSVEIAELTGKQHKNVTADIRSMMEQLGKDALDYQHIYFDSMNRKQSQFCLDRLHVECLLTGYSIPLRMKVLERLAELEQKNTSPAIPSNFADALRLAADQQEQIQQLQITHQQNTVKIDALEQLLSAGVTAPDFCRRLNGVNIMMVNAWLCESGWLIESGNAKARWRVASYARDRYMTERTKKVSIVGKEAFTTVSSVLLKAGAKRLVTLYMSGKLPMKKGWDGELKHDLAGVLGVVK